MQTTELTNDSKAILLLCGVFGGKANSNQINPLSITEYNSFASVLIEKNLRPGDILNPGLLEELNSEFKGRFEFERIKGLLNRGASLAFSIEKWINKGIWIITRSDTHYPQKLWKRFGKYCPPILFGAGDADLLNCEGLAVVGSRKIDPEGETYTKNIGEICAKLSIPVVSGGARGVDQIAMTSCLESYGSTIGILADGLLQASVSGKYRSAIMDRRLVLLSTYNPEARFNVGNAMSRNKYIYSFSKYALIVSSEKDKGGTWTGAIEELKRQNGIGVFVRTEGSAPNGNFELLKLGARPFPKQPWDESLIGELNDYIAIIEYSSEQTSIFDKIKTNG